MIHHEHTKVADEAEHTRGGRAVIGGAGPAGLTAAVELLDKTEVVPIVVEKDDMVGGISRTIDYNGNRLDIGGHRFFSKSQWVNKFWDRFTPMFLRKRRSHILYNGKYYEYPVSLNFQTLSNMGIKDTIKVGLGYLKTFVNRREEKSLEDFYINRFGRPLYEMFFESYTRKVWGVHPSELGAAWGSQRVKGLSIGGVLKDIFYKSFNIKRKKIETSLIDSFKYPDLGPGQLWDSVAAYVENEGGSLLLESEIVEIHVDESRKVDYVIIEDKDGIRHQLDCEYFFSSMPLKDLVSRLSGIDVPKDILHIARDLRYRDFITVGILVEELKMKSSHGPSCRQDNWIYIQEKNVRMGRIQIFNNWSPSMVKDAEDTVWLGLEYFCDENDDMWKMADEEFIEMAVKELVALGFIDKDSVIDAVRIKMKKAYPSYYGSYNSLDHVKCYLDRIDNLYCIGRNGQHCYNNMDHSMLTAREGVNALVSGNGDKSRVWNVNTEKAYHETVCSNFANGENET